MAAEHALAMGGRLIRRYCSCASAEPCTCGLKPRKSGWTAKELAALQATMKQLASVSAAALKLQRTTHDCNRALDVLVGRTPAHALAVLETQTARKWREARKKPARRPQ